MPARRGLAPSRPASPSKLSRRSATIASIASSALRRLEWQKFAEHRGERPALSFVPDATFPSVRAGVDLDCSDPLPAFSLVAFGPSHTLQAGWHLWPNRLRFELPHVPEKFVCEFASGTLQRAVDDVKVVRSDPMLACQSKKRSSLRQVGERVRELVREGLRQRWMCGEELIERGPKH